MEDLSMQSCMLEPKSDPEWKENEDEEIVVGLSRHLFRHKLFEVVV